MCCDACSRRAIVSSMYMVHMLGEGGTLLAHTHTCRHTCCNTRAHTHTHTHTIRALGGYKAVANSKSAPPPPTLGQEPTVPSSLREGRQRACVGGWCCWWWWRDAGYCKDGQSNAARLPVRTRNESRVSL